MTPGGNAGRFLLYRAWLRRCHEWYRWDSAWYRWDNAWYHAWNDWCHARYHENNKKPARCAGFHV